MKQTRLDSEKEKYVHDDYHEKLIFERYELMRDFQTAIELGDSKAALEMLYNAKGNIHTVNQIYSPKEENIRVLHNQLVSLNTMLTIYSGKALPNPLYLHVISRHYDVMIEKVASQEQANALIRSMVEDYCSLSEALPKKQYSSIIQKAVWHITADASRRTSLGELAQLLGMSPASLSRKFHAETGQTLSQYQMSFRIRTARQYLQEGCYSVTEVAYKAGFADASYFSKVFTHYVGMTPSEYARQNSFSAPVKTQSDG